MYEQTNKLVAYISNALDFSTDFERLAKHEKSDMDELRKIGLEPQKLDLSHFINRCEDLSNTLSSFAGVWVSGGNSFVLRQIYQLSGFDEILIDLHENRSQFVYGGYSAGICVLTPTLRGTELVDPINGGPY